MPIVNQPTNPDMTGDLNALRDLFLDPAKWSAGWKPNFADCQLLMAALWALSIQRKLPNGHRVCMGQIAKKQATLIDKKLGNKIGPDVANVKKVAA